MVGAAGSNQTAKVTTPKLTFNASTGSLNATDIVTSTIAPGFTVRKQNTSGEGGEFYLQRSDTSTLTGDLVIDIVGNTFRIFEAASPYKGVTVDIGAQGSQSALLTSTNFGSYIGSLAVGEVGTYAFLVTASSGTAYNPGATLAGSALRYANATPATGGTPTTPAGTWRCMGYSNASGATPSGRVTVWLRIS